LLRDAAEVIFQGSPTTQRSTLSFNDLVDILRVCFNPAHVAEIKSNQLHARKQLTNETVSDFAVAIERLTLETYPDLPDDVRDHLMRRFFVNGLRKNNFQIVIGSNHQTFVTAESHAIEHG